MNDRPEAKRNGMNECVGDEGMSGMEMGLGIRPPEWNEWMDG